MGADYADDKNAEIDALRDELADAQADAQGWCDVAAPREGDTPTDLPPDVKAELERTWCPDYQSWHRPAAGS